MTKGVGRSKGQRRSGQLEGDLGKIVVMEFVDWPRVNESGRTLLPKKHKGRLVKTDVPVEEGSAHTSKGYLVINESGEALQLPIRYIQQRLQLNGTPLYAMKDNYVEKKWCR